MIGWKRNIFDHSMFYFDHEQIILYVFNKNTKLKKDNNKKKIAIEELREKKLKVEEFRKENTLSEWDKTYDKLNIIENITSFYDKDLLKMQYLLLKMLLLLLINKDTTFLKNVKTSTDIDKITKTSGMFGGFFKKEKDKDTLVKEIRDQITQNNDRIEKHLKIQHKKNKDILENFILKDTETKEKLIESLQNVMNLEYNEIDEEIQILSKTESPLKQMRKY